MVDKSAYSIYTRHTLLLVTTAWKWFGPHGSAVRERNQINMDKKTKEKIIKKFRTHESDTGSSQVQIAILSAEIKELTEHLQTHKKDHSSRRGLLRKVSERRRLLRYLEHEDQGAFEDLVKKLKLKIAKRYDAEAIKAAEQEAEDALDDTDEDEDLDS